MLVLELSSKSVTSEQKSEAMGLLKTLSKESDALRLGVKEQEVQIAAIEGLDSVHALLEDIKTADAESDKLAGEIMCCLDDRANAYFDDDISGMLQAQNLLVQKIEKDKRLADWKAGLIKICGSRWAQLHELKRERLKSLERLCEINVELAMAGFRRG